MNSPNPAARKNKKSVFKRVNNWVHLWLGLGSGIIVLVVCVTGCIWVFNEEITYFFEKEDFIAYENKPVLTPSQIAAVGKKTFPKLESSYARYQQGKVVYLSLKEAGVATKKGMSNQLLRIHPYTGAIVGKDKSQSKFEHFFRFILDGHRALWLPYEIGRPIINYAVLAFVVILVTGLIWWYPQKWTSATRNKSFKIKWGASFKRLNLDLHNVLGFYALIFLFCISVTGIVFGIQWFSKGIYWVTTGGEQLDNSFRTFKSDSTKRRNTDNLNGAMDQIWAKVQSENPQSQGFYYTYPDQSSPTATITVIVYPTASQFYNSRSYTFDQYTFQSVKRTDPYAIPYREATIGQKLRKMNFDIHVGAILGFPGKILAFFASLIGASLPITGFLVWWGRKFKKSKKKQSFNH